MNDKSPTSLDSLLDQIPVGQAPIRDLLTFGRAAKRRKRRTLIAGVAAATVLILGGGTIATQALGDGGRTDIPSAERTPAAVDLTVRVVSGVHSKFIVMNSEDGSITEGASWEADSQSLTYLSDRAYSSSCPPTASATLTDNGVVTLAFRDYDGNDICTADEGQVTVLIDGVSEAPASLTVTDNAGTRTLPVTVAPTTGLPQAAPDDTHLVGIGQVAIAIPNDWKSNDATCSTPTPRVGIYYFPTLRDCPPSEAELPSGSAWVAVTTSEFVEFHSLLFDGPKPDGEIDGHKVVGNGVVCRLGASDPCTQVFGIPDLDAYVTVTADAHLMGEIRNSLTLIGPDETIVPSVPYNNESDAAAALEAAGLSVRTERVTCPRNANCAILDVIEPAPGSVVPKGSAVTLRVLD